MPGFLIRSPDPLGLAVGSWDGAHYLMREVASDEGRGFAVSKLAGATYHVADGPEGMSCECHQFLTHDWCKHSALVRAAFIERVEEGEQVSDRYEGGPPEGWIDSPMKAGLPTPPAQIAELPVAPNGYPVPWFVSWVHGKPEFRAADARKMMLAIRDRRCWVCGYGIAPGPVTFVLGPMCTVNRVSAEPPSHFECAKYSAEACPFLTKPQMVRRESDLPEDTVAPPGEFIKGNPGVTALYTTSVYQAVRQGEGILFDIGKAAKVDWLAEGKPATRAQVEEAYLRGIVGLENMAKEQGEDALKQLSRMDAEARLLWPKA